MNSGKWLISCLWHWFYNRGDSGDMRGRARLAGTRVPVHRIARYHRLGYAPEEISACSTPFPCPRFTPHSPTRWRTPMKSKNRSGRRTTWLSSCPLSTIWRDVAEPLSRRRHFNGTRLSAACRSRGINLLTTSACEMGNAIVYGAALAKRWKALHRMHE